MHSSRRSIPLIALVALAACDSPVGPPPPEIVSIELTASELLVQPMRIALENEAPVVVEYWTPDEPRLQVHSRAARNHELALTRLLPGRDYEYRVIAASARGEFATAELPPELAAVRMRATGTAGTPLVMLHLFSSEGFRGYAAVDGRGRVVWYWPTEHIPFGMTRRDNGNFVFMDRDRGLLEVSPAGQVVHELPQDTVAREMHHDVIASSANSLLFIAFDDREVDGARVRGEALWEWRPESGQVDKRWISWDHLSLEDDRGPRFNDEWMHANSLSLGPAGDVLMSVHYFNQVLSISPDWSRIERRLGGVNATVEVAEPAAFSGQHTAAELAPGRVLLFDNGIDRGGPSRALELELDGGLAVEAWSWTPPNGNFATAVGSARRLANGNTLVGFGMAEGLAGSTGPIEVYEVTPDGATAWHLTVGGPQVMYRAEPLEAVGVETVPPE